MYDLLNKGLHSKRGVIRKASALTLLGWKRIMPKRHAAEEFAAHPPVLANSFPKSGTHLLDQIVAGLPGRVNYGAFLSSMISSAQYRPRTPQSTLRFINSSLPGEVVRAHLFYAPEYEAALQQHNFAHYFIYRDPRDVVLSMSNFLRYMYPWHRLSRRVRRLPSDEDAVRYFIEGEGDGGPDSFVPNVAEWFRAYEGWVASPEAYAVRFEDLVGPDRDARIEDMVRFYAARSGTPTPIDETVARILALIAPEKSHTFRQGKRGGWQDAFTPELKAAFKRVAGELLIRLGYERDLAW
jgi:hypothetical protein